MEKFSVIVRIADIYILATIIPVILNRQKLLHLLVKK